MISFLPELLAWLGVIGLVLLLGLMLSRGGKDGREG